MFDSDCSHMYKGVSLYPGALNIYHEALEQIECADQLGYDCVLITEHYCLEAYCHASALEVFLAAAARSKKSSARARHRTDAAEAKPSGAIRTAGGGHKMANPTELIDPVVKTTLMVEETLSRMPST
jgi:hypothetical protein